jgi:maleylacetoacetate isomerase
MADFRLFNYFRSSTSYRVRLALSLKNLNFDYEPVHLVNNGGEQYTETFKSLNPSKSVPTLVEQDFTLSQSLAIIYYLEKTHPHPPLWPDDIKKQSQILQFCEIINADLHWSTNLRVLQYMKKNFEFSEDQQVAWANEWGNRAFEACEELVSRWGGDFCFGNQITWCETFLIPALFAANRFQVDTRSFKRLTKINEKCLSLESFKKAHPDFQPDSPKS